MVLAVSAVAGAVPLALGCGGDRGDEREQGGEPAKPPTGWRTVQNRAAGFTLAVPRRWKAQRKGVATIVRSDDRLVAVTFSADRSREGREVPPPLYARQTLGSLPGFEGSVDSRVRPVRGSPYRSARVEAVGRVASSPRTQRVSVAAFQIPNLVTYSAIGFRNARVAPTFNDRTLARVLATLRAGAKEEPRQAAPPRG